MERYFLSEENVKNQTKLFILHLQIPREQLSKKVYVQLQTIIVNSMRTTFKKYNVPEMREKYEQREFFDKINKKSLSNSVKLYHERSKQYNKPSQPQNQYGVPSTSNIKPEMFNNPNERFANQNEQPSRNLAPAMSDGNGFAQWNSNETSQFMHATGEYGNSPLAVGMGQQYNNNLDKKSSYSDDLIRRMSNLQEERDANGNPKQPPQTDAQISEWLGLNRGDNRGIPPPPQQQNGGNFGYNNYTPNQYGAQQPTNNPNYNPQPPPPQQMQQNNPFDGAFNSAPDNVGSDFNSAYSDPKQQQNNAFESQNSYNNFFPEVKKQSFENIDWNAHMKQKQQELRETITIAPSQGKFDPTVSPNLPQGQSQGSNNPFFFQGK